MSTEVVIAIVASVLASGGLWGFLQFYVSKKMEAKDVRTQMLIGLGHDRIIWLGMKYIERGYITHDEYENLVDYLFKPYEAIGGNGSAKRIVDEVKKLPVKPNGYVPATN